MLTNFNPVFLVNSSTFISGNGCVETDYTYLNPGDFKVMYCFVNNTGGSYNPLKWALPTIAILALNSVPTHSMGYTATVVGGNATKMTLNSV